jgi:hypothetical protein
MDLSRKHIMILWELLGEGGGAFQKDLRQKFGPADRKALGKLILVEKRGRANFIEVSDDGWAFAAENLDAPLDQRHAIFQSWLGKLKKYLGASGVSLSEFFAPAETKTAAPDLRARIRAAYLEATGDKWNSRALLSEVRKHLCDISRDEQDQTLRDMHRAQEIGLVPNDNRRAITPADEQAALSIAGERRHIILIEN